MSALPLPLLLILFAGAAVSVWFAGTLYSILLSSSTDILIGQYGLGEALGGLILLAIATNLPKIAIIGDKRHLR